MKSRAIIFLVVIIAGGLLNLMCSKGGSSDSSASESNEPSGVVKIERFNLTQQRSDGSKLRLTAETARLLTGGDKAELEEADIVYYLKDGHEVSAHAEKGVINIKSGYSQAHGNVVMHTDYGFWFLSNSFTYDPEPKKIYVEGEYIAFGPELVITGKELVVDLNAESFESGGPVVAQIWDFSELQKRVE